MIKRKSTNEEKLEAVQNYQQGKESVTEISFRLNVGKTTVHRWIGNYESQGESGIIKQPKNSIYSKELKTAVVAAYHAGQGSQTELCKKFHLRSTRQLHNWINVYNGHKELRSSGGRGSGIYMTKGKATTLEERIEIIYIPSPKCKLFYGFSAFSLHLLYHFQTTKSVFMRACGSVQCALFTQNSTGYLQ
jgi:transposase